MAGPAARKARDDASSPDVQPEVTEDHVGPDEIYALLEQRLTRRQLRTVEAHFEACADCVETLAMVLRTDRPATREEQQFLAQTTERSTEDLVSALRPRIEASMPSGPERSGVEWKPIVLALVIASLLITAGLVVRTRYWLPAASRRAASDTLEALVELRQATGRVPLRYITEFERAGVVRSGFDSTDAIEESLLANLRAAVERAPEPEALIVLGLLLLDEGELDEAEQWLNEAREARPHSVDAINGLAVIHYEKAERHSDEGYALQQRGLALLRQAEQIDPNDLRVLFNYGKYYEAMGMRSAAIKAWTRYLEKDSVSQWAEEAAYQLAQLTPSNR